jgi:hypothetical protein
MNMKRSIQQYGTKRYAMHEMRALMRAWAAAKRVNTTSGRAEYQRDVNFGQVIGARSALRAVGALTDAQYDSVSRRIKRMLSAQITRRPFALRRAA